jgi:signal transduction histidine kinase
MQAQLATEALERAATHGMNATLAIAAQFAHPSSHGRAPAAAPTRRRGNLPRDHEGWTALLSALCEQRAITAQAMDALASMAASVHACAIAQERERLAREMHDGVAQAFIGINMLLAAAPGSEGDLVRRAQRLAQQGLQESRSAIHALLPTQLISMPFDAAVREMASAVVPPHMALQVESIGDWSALPAERACELFRMIQEAVNNAVKHSAARKLKIDLSCNDSEAVALVSDDGRGFSVAGRDGAGFGLTSMRQRAASTGARVDIVSNFGGGTQVFVSMALKKASGV